MSSITSLGSLCLFFLGLFVPNISALTAQHDEDSNKSNALAEQSARQMSAAARGFLQSLAVEQRNIALRDFDDEGGRTYWSNLPAMFVERSGIRLGDLSNSQRRRLHDLMRASTSSQGYQKIAGVIRLDEILHEDASAAVRNGTRDLPDELVESWTAENYWVSVFGDPQQDSTWGWQLSGHHLAANFTVFEGRLSFTPMFLGAEPHEVMDGLDAGWKVLAQEAERGFELLQSLDSEQRSKAVIGSHVPRDVFEGPGRKGDIEHFSGLSASELNAAQSSLLWALLREYVGNADHDAAAAHLDKIMADGLGRVYFAWIGPVDDVNSKYYYRVHGPSILIEYVVEEGVGGAAANHTHSIVRDPGNDYGADWLDKHYKESHDR